MIILSKQDYRKRVLGCWMGKASGGTLGQPFEGQKGPLNLTFYDPIPQGPVPNDDLDLQVLWALLVEKHGPWINRLDLAKGWQAHTDFPWDEYGSATANFARGIYPPASGHHSNFFGDCMGSPIRSEIWAAMAPADPELASRLAYEDAILDHDGEGIWGEIFWAVMESAAFVIQDRDRLLSLGLSAIPESSRVAQAVWKVIDWYGTCKDWRTVREKILQHFGHVNFTDTPQNLAFAVLGWLAGKDFGEAICIAVNCGQDTDCSGASLGALLGIVDPDGISEEWKKPVSNDLKLLPYMKNLNPPRTLGSLTDLTIRLAEKMIQARSTKVKFAAKAAKTDVDYALNVFETKDSPDSILLADEPVRIEAIYPEGLTFVPGENIAMTLRFTNQTRNRASMNVQLLLPTGWKRLKGEIGLISLLGNESRDIFVRLGVPADIRQYDEHITLRLENNGVRNELQIPMISAWQWKMSVNGRRAQTLWQPERIILPLRNGGIRIKPGETLTASTQIHLSRAMRIRLILASNGSGTLAVDGKHLLNYRDAIFAPMTHRAEQGTFGDIDLSLGRHTLELTLQFSHKQPRAALLLADAHNALLLHDITVAADLTRP